MFLFSYYDYLQAKSFYFEASRGARAESVTVKSTGCGFDTHSRR